MKLFLTAFILLILLATAVGGFYFYANSKPKQLNPLAFQPVTSEPVSLNLDVNSPSDDTLSFDPNLIVSGKTSPNAEILISSDTKDWLVESKADGSFSTLVDLDEGTNNLQISAFDQKGEEKEIDRTVYYSKEKIQ